MLSKLSRSSVSGNTPSGRIILQLQSFRVGNEDGALLNFCSISAQILKVGPLLLNSVSLRRIVDAKRSASVVILSTLSSSIAIFFEIQVTLVRPSVRSSS